MWKVFLTSGKVGPILTGLRKGMCVYWHYIIIIVCKYNFRWREIKINIKISVLILEIKCYYYISGHFSDHRSWQNWEGKAVPHNHPQFYSIPNRVKLRLSLRKAYYVVFFIIVFVYTFHHSFHVADGPPEMFLIANITC